MGGCPVLEECVAAPGEVDDLGQMVRDYRDLWTSVASDRLDKALHQQTAASGSEYSAGILAHPVISRHLTSLMIRGRASSATP